MPASLRIVQVNLAYDAAIVSATELLDRYHTLTGLSQALSRAGADVRVVQRFSSDERTTRDRVRYQFLPDASAAPMPPPQWASSAIAAAVAAEAPDVVHVNGVMFPAMVGLLRDMLPDAAIVVQDHAGAEAPGVIDRLRDPSWQALRSVDAWSFTALAHAASWRRAGLIEGAEVLELLEASASLAPIDRAEAQLATAIRGDPAVLWVGRLNENKDPLTVLAGLEAAFREMPGARATMIYSDNTLEALVQRTITRSPALRDRVTLIGRVAHADMARYYSAADIYISGSRREGSGYALIEAMACGLAPVVTDIPSFRVIAGDCGALWRVGDEFRCADALLRVTHQPFAPQRQRVRDRFERELSWDAIGTKTVAAYRALVNRKRSGTAR